MNSLATLLSVAALGSTSRAGSVIVVAPSGGNYAQIQPAVDAASDGDTILVKSGSYRRFTIFDKTLSVVADTGADVQVDAEVQVVDLTVARDVVLSGLNIVDRGNDASHGGSALRLAHDLGSVRVENCELTGYACDQSAACVSGRGAELVQCADVCFARCGIVGGSGGWGVSGIDAYGSTCAAYDCASVGGWTFDLVGDAACTPADGGQGASVNASFVFASGSTFQGGNGGLGTSGGLGCACGADSGSGGSGVASYSISSSARLLDDAYVAGKAAAVRACVGCCSTFGECCPGQDGVEAGGHDVVFLTGAARHFTIDSPCRERTTVPIQARGRAGDDVYLFLADRTTFRFVPGYRGVQLTQQPRAPIHLGVVGSGGTLTRTLTFPDLGPGIQSKTFFLQTAHRGPQGDWTLGSPVSLVVLDQAF